jgi:hypothetical protein
MFFFFTLLIFYVFLTNKEARTYYSWNLIQYRRFLLASRCIMIHFRIIFIRRNLFFLFINIQRCYGLVDHTGSLIDNKYLIRLFRIIFISRFSCSIVRLLAFNGLKFMSWVHLRLLNTNILIKVFKVIIIILKDKQITSFLHNLIK